MKHLFFALLYFFATVATAQTLSEYPDLKDIKRIMNASFKTKLIRK